MQLPFRRDRHTARTPVDGERRSTQRRYVNRPASCSPRAIGGGAIGTAIGLRATSRSCSVWSKRPCRFSRWGDGTNALRILEPIGEAFVDDWLDHAYDTDEHMYELFADLGRVIAEAALMSELAADERDALAETLEEWQGRLEEYGIEEGFHVAIRALQTGWDDPALAAVLAGQGRSWPPSGAHDWLEDKLTAVRLRVLEACGRTDQYLNLARAARAHTSYACMLVKLERTPEATAYAVKSFKKPDEVLVLAKALCEAAAHDDALKIADAGLGLAGDDENEMEGSSVVSLACWLRDYAGGIGRTAVALKAARVAFEHSLSLEAFRAV